MGQMSKITCHAPCDILHLHHADAVCMTVSFYLPLHPFLIACTKFSYHLACIRHIEVKTQIIDPLGDRDNLGFLIKAKLSLIFCIIPHLI